MRRAVGIPHSASRLWRPALLPVLGFIVLIAVLDTALSPRLAASLVFDPPVLMLILNTVFLFGISFAVCIVVMRAYLASGSSGVLLLGCGVLSLGGAALAGGWVRPLGGGANTSVTIHNLGVLLGAILFAMSALLALFKVESEGIVERRRQKLFFGFTGTLILLALIIVATLRDMAPLFWAAGAGSTPLKHGVVGTAVALFTLTSIYTMVLYFQKRSSFLYWYSLALALTAIGLIGITVMKAVGDPIGWAGRTAQYLGGVYFLIAARSALREAQTQGLTLEAAIDRFYSRSEVHYRDLVDTVSDAIISVDDRRRVLLWNPGAERMFGYTAGEAAGCLVSALVMPEGHKERLEDELEGLQKQITNPFASKELEIEMRRKDDTLFRSETALSARQIGSGWTATLVVRDVTEKRRAQEALLEAHERAAWLARFPEQNPNPIIRASADGTVLYCNPASAKLSEWRCETGRMLQNDLIPLVGRAIAESKELQEDVHLGGRTYIVWIVPFPGEGYVNIYGRDITERKRVEEALRQSEARRLVAEAVETERQRLYDVLETLPVMICLLTLDYHVAFANRSFRGKFGGSGGRHCYEYRFGRSGPCDFCESYKVLQTGKPHHWEVTAPDGSSVIDTYDFPFIDVDGSPLILEMGIDITERKQTEVALRESESRLRHLSSQLLIAQEQERKRIAGELHDSIAAILGAIKFSIEKTLGQMEQDSAASESLKALISLTQQANEETRRIMADLRPSILDDLGVISALGWFCRDFQKRYSHLRVDKRIDLNEEEIPEILKTSIFRISQEALGNAAKHSGADLVDLSLRKGDNGLQLTIKDNGQGFDPIEAGPNREPGKKLGLTSMRERAELSGGSFDLDSATGKGTMIRVSWPLT